MSIWYSITLKGLAIGNTMGQVNFQHRTEEFSSYVDKNSTLILEIPTTDPLLSSEFEGNFVNERIPINKGCRPCRC